MIWPCPSKVDCAGSDYPLMNVSSEGPDLPQYSSVGFCCNGQQAWAFSLASQEAADDTLQRLMATSCPGCHEPTKYCADARCPDGTLIATYCLPTSQAEADALANIAEEAALPFCGNFEDLYSATCACPDGTNPLTMYSAISEADALAACESVPKDCPPPCNTEQTCSVLCPDGTEFTYVIPACTIYALTVAEANAQAYALACQRAAQLRVCLSSIPLCACLGQAYFGSIKATGNPGPLTWSVVSGDVPDGLTIAVASNTLTAVVSGIPTNTGTFNFTVLVQTSQGSYAIHSYSIRVIAITTSALPDYGVGVPYSFQMQAAGGSGNYAWSIVSGTLPDGLTMTAQGLIQGTPTSTGGITNLVFSVIDLSCEGSQRNLFIPRVSLTTAATTVLKTRRGYPKFTGDDGTLYKKITWSGEIEQTAIVTQTGQFCGGAKYVFSGTDEINALGVFTSSHKKELIVACPRSPVSLYPPVAEGPSAVAEVNAPGLFAGSSTSRIHNLLGYCWPLDLNSCPVCSDDADDWTLLGDFATHSPTDAPTNMLVDPEAFDETDTERTYDGTGTGIFAIGDVGNFPFIAPGLDGFELGLYTTISATGFYTATLSDVYTDEEAEATQQTFLSKLATAENKPDYQQASGNDFLRVVYSRVTTVNYTFLCSNLIPGFTYRLTYKLADSNGTTTTETLTFTAANEIESVTGTLPLPEEGRTLTIKNPKIQYST